MTDENVMAPAIQKKLKELRGNAADNVVANWPWYFVALFIRPFLPLGSTAWTISSEARSVRSSWKAWMWASRSGMGVNSTDLGIEGHEVLGVEGFGHDLIPEGQNRRDRQRKFATLRRGGQTLVSREASAQGKKFTRRWM